jgi:hypothetical protein
VCVFGLKKHAYQSTQRDADHKQENPHMNDEAITPTNADNDGENPDVQPAAAGGSAADTAVPFAVRMPPMMLAPNVAKVEVTTNAITRLGEEHWYQVTISPDTTYSFILLQPMVAHPADQLVVAAFDNFDEEVVAGAGSPSVQGRPPAGSSVAHGDSLTTGSSEVSCWFRVAERNGDAITLGPYVFGVQRVG